MNVVDLIRKINDGAVSDQDMANYLIWNIAIDVDAKYNCFINPWKDGLYDDDEYLDPRIPLHYNLNPELRDIDISVILEQWYDKDNDKYHNRLYIEFYRYVIDGFVDYINKIVCDIFNFITEEFVSKYDFSLKGLLCNLCDNLRSQTGNDPTTPTGKGPKSFSTNNIVKNINAYSIGKLTSVSGSITINRYLSIDDILPMGSRVYYNDNGTSDKYEEYAVIHSKIVDDTDSGLELTLLPEDTSNGSIVIKTSPWEHNRTNILTYDPNTKYIETMKTIEKATASIKLLSERISKIEKDLENAKATLELFGKEKKK